MNFKTTFGGVAGDLSAQLTEIESDLTVATVTGLKDAKAVAKWARQTAALHKATMAVEPSSSQTVTVSGHDTFHI